MKKWEYTKIVEGVPFSESSLNEWGEKGWEVVTIIYHPSTISDPFPQAGYEIIFKREKE